MIINTAKSFPDIVAVVNVGEQEVWYLCFAVDGEYSYI